MTADTGPNATDGAETRTPENPRQARPLKCTRSFAEVNVTSAVAVSNSRIASRWTAEGVGDKRVECLQG